MAHLLKLSAWDKKWGEKEYTADEIKAGVLELRTRFFDDSNAENRALYEECDMERIRKDDFYCGKFVSFFQMDIEKALFYLQQSYKWRKKFGVAHIKESSLSIRHLEMGMLYPYNLDKNGNPVIMIIGKLYKKEYSDEMKKIVVYWVEKVTKENPTKQFTGILDCAGVSYANMDMDGMKFIASFFIRNYPFVVANFLIYDMPWIFNAIWTFFKQVLPKKSREKIKFVNKTSITEYIDPKNLPVRMGGEDTYEFKFDPDEVANLERRYLGGE